MSRLRLTLACWDYDRVAALADGRVKVEGVDLDFLAQPVEETRREFGEDWWPCGLAANRHALDTFLRYHHEQGPSPRRLQPEALFAPETLESFVI